MDLNEPTISFNIKRKYICKINKMNDIVSEFRFPAAGKLIRLEKSRQIKNYIAKPDHINLKYIKPIYTIGSHTPDFLDDAEVAENALHKINLEDTSGFGDTIEDYDDDNLYDSAVANEYLQIYTKLKQKPQRFVTYTEGYDLSAYYGPLNSTVAKDCSAGYDGCRMLTCNCVGDEDWFTKECDICQMDIPKKCWAVRYPMLYGGWNGCYCSMSCMETDPLNNESSSKRYQTVYMELPDMVDC